MKFSSFASRLYIPLPVSQLSLSRETLRRFQGSVIVSHSTLNYLTHLLEDLDLEGLS